MFLLISDHVMAWDSKQCILVLKQISKFKYLNNCSFKYLISSVVEIFGGFMENTLVDFQIASLT